MESVEEVFEKNGICTILITVSKHCDSPNLFRKIKAILNMFPGKSNVVVYFADTKQRRGTKCILDDRMIDELNHVLGHDNVVIK